MTNLAYAWAEWDRVMAAMPRRPPPRFGERETNAMEDACQILAASLGVPCTQLRSDLARARRAGMGYEQAITAVAAAGGQH